MNAKLLPTLLATLSTSILSLGMCFICVLAKKTFAFGRNNLTFLLHLCRAPDGSFIASGSGDRTTKLWDWSSRSCRHTLGATEAAGGPSDGVTSVQIAPDSTIVAVASLDHLVRLW